MDVLMLFTINASEFHLRVRPMVSRSDRSDRAERVLNESYIHLTPNTAWNTIGIINGAIRPRFQAAHPSSFRS